MFVLYLSIFVNMYISVILNRTPIGNVCRGLWWELNMSLIILKIYFCNVYLAFVFCLFDICLTFVENLLNIFVIFIQHLFHIIEYDSLIPKIDFTSLRRGWKMHFSCILIAFLTAPRQLKLWISWGVSWSLQRNFRWSKNIFLVKLVLGHI